MTLSCRSSERCQPTGRCVIPHEDPMCARDPRSAGVLSTRGAPQDLTLIEAIDKSINAARKRADKCFEVCRGGRPGLFRESSQASQRSSGF